MIARSFAFIFQRNMPNLGLLGISMQDEEFYQVAADGKEVSIDFNTKSINLDGRAFHFDLSQMEKELFEHGGISSAFQHFGSKLFEVMTSVKGQGGGNRQDPSPEPNPQLAW